MSIAPVSAVADPMRDFARQLLQMQEHLDGLRANAREQKQHVDPGRENAERVTLGGESSAELLVDGTFDGPAGSSAGMTFVVLPAAASGAPRVGAYDEIGELVAEVDLPTPEVPVDLGNGLSVQRLRGSLVSGDYGSPERSEPDPAQRERGAAALREGMLELGGRMNALFDSLRTFNEDDGAGMRGASERLEGALRGELGVSTEISEGLGLDFVLSGEFGSLVLLAPEELDSALNEDLPQALDQLVSSDPVQGEGLLDRLALALTEVTRDAVDRLDPGTYAGLIVDMEI